MTKNKKIIGAVISHLIIAFIYVVIIGLFSYIVFYNKINMAMGMINTFFIKNEIDEENNNTKIDNNTLKLQSYPEYGTRYGSLKIDSLNIDLPLYYGDLLSILKNGIGHTSGSYFPGEGGTILCMGHNTKSFLRELPNIKINDIIEIETDYGRFKYQVYNTKIVEQTNLDSAKIQDEEEILILYTCYPVNSVGHAKNRFLTYSKLVESEFVKGE